MTMSSTTTSTTSTTPTSHKRVRICLESVRVYHMPQDNREEYLDKLFYSPQELKVFQDEKFEEEAAALQWKKEKQAAEKKKEKEIKKKQRKERLRARKQARLAKKDNNHNEHTDNDSDYGLLSTSSSDSEEPTTTYSASRDAQSTKRPLHTSRRLRNRKTVSNSKNTHPPISVDLSALEQGNNPLPTESSSCSTPSSVSTATTECSTPPPLSPTESLQEQEDDLQSPCSYNHHEESPEDDAENDLELAVSLLPTEPQQQDPTQSSLFDSTNSTSNTLLTDKLQRQLKQWKSSTLILFGLLVLSWIYFSFLAH